MHEFDIVIIEDQTGGYIAFVHALPGCHIQGDTHWKNLQYSMQKFHFS